MLGGPRLVVAADDRTGSLETAGGLADVCGVPVPVVGGVAPDRIVDEVVSQLDEHRFVVVDLGSRHLAPDVAARRALAIDQVGSTHAAHKIDSTLRGNWAHEVVARAGAVGRAVLVVPSLPGLGRACVGGVVLEAGVPVHEGPAGRDPRSPVDTSRPDELLRRAGARHVVSVTDDRALGDWLADPVGIAVCDAASADDLSRIARRWSLRADVLLAGTAAAVAAAGATLAVDAPAAGSRRTAAPRADRIVVVCGSLHPAARAQVERAARAGAVVIEEVDDVAQPTPRVVVLRSPAPGPEPSPADADTVAGALADRAGRLVELLRPDAIVVVGGDTAAAVLGDALVHVHGSLAPGTPWGIRACDGMVVVTRAGGFGGPDALVELLWGTLCS